MEANRALYSAEDIARYTVDKCYRDGKPISNLQLQKMLYLLQVVFLKVFRMLLFSEEFEAWPYGPVLRSIYIEFSEYGGSPIRESFDMKSFKIEREHAAFLDEGIEFLRRRSPWDLVRISHADGSPWDRVYNDMGDHKGTIPNKFIIESVFGDGNE